MEKIQKNMGSNYSWVICAVGALMVFCCAGLTYTGFSPYQPYLVSVRGLTNTQTAMITTIRNLFSMTSMLFVSRLMNRFGLRRVAVFGMLCCAASFFTFSMADGWLMHYAAAAIAGCAHGLGGMIPASILISRWFQKHNGLALGLVMAATGFSAFIGSPIITWAINHISLEAAFRGQAIFILLAAILVYAVLRSRPACLNLQPLGAELSHDSAFSYKKENRTYAGHSAPKSMYLLMCFLIFLFGMPGGSLTTNLSLLFRTEGYDSTYIGVVLSFFGVAVALGKCIYGQLSDLLGMLRSTILMYAVLYVGNALCCFAGCGNDALAMISALCVGFGLAVTSVSCSTYALHISTEEEYPRVVARFQLMSSLGQLTFSPIPGMIADATGSYIPAYIVLLLITVISSVSLLLTFAFVTRLDQNRA